MRRRECLEDSVVGVMVSTKVREFIIGGVMVLGSGVRTSPWSVMVSGGNDETKKFKKDRKIMERHQKYCPEFVVSSVLSNNKKKWVRSREKFFIFSFNV